jgi:hypothetical protein
MRSPAASVSGAPKRAISSEPGIAATAQVATGTPIRIPTWVSLRCRSWWISGITGGTPMTGMRIAAPASHNRHRSFKRRPVDGPPSAVVVTCMRTGNSCHRPAM